MLRKLAAIGALTLGLAAVQASAGTSHDHHDSYDGSYENGGKSDNNYKGGDSGGDTVTLTIPAFSNDWDVIKWVKSVEHCDQKNVFEQLLKLTREDDYDLPKCDVKVLKDITEDIKDLEHELKEAKHDKGDGWDLKDQIKDDAHDIRKDVQTFDYILLNGCGCDEHHHDDCGSPCAVPLPAAAQQGLVGFGVLGLIGLAYKARRGMLARSA